MQQVNGTLYHADMSHVSFSPLGVGGMGGRELEVEWVPLQQSMAGGEGSGGGGAKGGVQMPACVREIPGLVVARGAAADGAGAGGVCVMFVDGYYSVFSDTSLDQIDFETAARGFVGIAGTSHALQLLGYPRAHASSSASRGRGSAKDEENELGESELLPHVPPIVLGDGQIVSARYGPIPSASPTSDKGVEEEKSRPGSGKEKRGGGGKGGLLEVVDSVAGVVRQLSVLPPKEPKIDLLVDDAKEVTAPHGPARVMKIVAILPMTKGTKGEAGEAASGDAGPGGAAVGAGGEGAGGVVQGDMVSIAHQKRGREMVSVVSVWRMASAGRDLELQQWRQTMGLATPADSRLRLTRKWDKGKKAPESKGPKHGKAPDGKRHAGGNTWAGGTGGTDTAGMGGKVCVCVCVCEHV